jgi:hypothetical protein
VLASRIALLVGGSTVKRREIKIEEGPGDKTWGRTKFTTVLDRAQLNSLKQISDATRIPISALIGKAIDIFFQELGGDDERKVVPIDTSFIKERMSEQTNKPVEEGN